MDYVIDGGKSGKSRLSVLGEAMNEYSLNALKKAGLKLGDRCLDLGCGGGDMTYIIAALVGIHGHVTGIDYDAEIIALNKQEQAGRGISYISFEQGDVYQIDTTTKYDVVYARYLLSHLAEPERLLQKIYTALKPGGIILIEDIQFSGHFCYPASKEFDEYLQLYSKLVSSKGGNAERGVMLYNDLTNAGFKNVALSVAQPAGAEGPAKRMGLLTFEKVRHALLESGIVTEDKYNEIWQELNKITQNKEVIMSIARTFQVWGVKQ